ncbi:type II toxin-antitoxin system VapC family toxin [Gloeocapsopsis dulcis]|uniref:Nucleic acid-binding protein n=1 Tax=Gloeocapsopsis dulcis AAB1 = 1H9 TaxID=1433147 RepID=A0A6N8FVD8_9CHRO|nr:PIN domain-containing protein [Gloeocapsopsis dulcis]MUL37088.1 nucleic acid-binding protein [Gloeocapsopsis dulcis AAB1 = 1H9]WNN88372.1 PIN domain-containing protein [Gloeocapsopsis dulcis]
MPIHKVFLDTSYLLALELANDQNHQAAQTHWQQVITNTRSFVTTSYIFDEVVTYFNSRNHHAKAVQVGNRLLLSPSVQLVHVDQALFYLGWAYFQQYQDKQYSLTDSISFVVMQQYDIQVAYTFDQHFTQAGFQKEPQ